MHATEDHAETNQPQLTMLWLFIYNYNSSDGWDKGHVKDNHPQ